MINEAVRRALATGLISRPQLLAAVKRGSARVRQIVERTMREGKVG